MLNDKNTGTLGYWMDNEELHESQHTVGIDFTVLYCGKTPQEPCTRTSSKYMWMKRYQGCRGLLYNIRYMDRGRHAWHCVLLKDDEETIREFIKDDNCASNLSRYCEVLKSGWGKDPPQEVVDELFEPYF